MESIEPFHFRDLEQIKEHGLTLKQVQAQIEHFKKGFPFIKLLRPCKVRDGITQIEETKFEDCRQLFAGARNDGRVLKFVPASGAATRMFKLLSEVHGKPPEECEQDIYFQKFIEGLPKLAFYSALEESLQQKGGNLKSLLATKQYGVIVEEILSSEGLGFATLPKGLVHFHRYGDIARTAFHEHIVEGSAYAIDIEGSVKLHFTVSENRLMFVKIHIEESIKQVESEEVKIDVTYSAQSPATDTIAVDRNNQPFRDHRGRLVFRPGGHGALIHNLNGIGDIVFIKNIDNVVHDRLKDITYIHKEVLGGYLILIQDQIFYYLRQLESNKITKEEIEEAFILVEERLWMKKPAHLENATDEEKKKFLSSFFHRPIRVCGVVRNDNEPGGGPFWIEGENGEPSMQIVESSQVNFDDESQKKIWYSATHFNPVDIVCGLKDFKEQSFDLQEFIDTNTGFISIKSSEGRELKALELPGLWNGAMAKWITIFVEVPKQTFNPVKTVLDLLRDEHQ